MAVAIREVRSIAGAASALSGHDSDALRAGLTAVVPALANKLATDESELEEVQALLAAERSRRLEARAAGEVTILEWPFYRTPISDFRI